MSDLSQRIAGLSSEKRALLERRKERARQNLQLKKSVSQIQPIPREGKFLYSPLSIAQEKVWYAEQQRPEDPWNCVLGVRIGGRLNFEALRRSFSEIVRRHESLRTSIDVVDGDPVQVIAPDMTPPFAVRDLSKLSEEERESEVRHWAATEARRNFDLTRGPLLRVTVHQLNEDETVLLLTIHNLITDGWSNRALMRELLLLYSAFSSGRASPLPELCIQYADYAHWQRRWLQSAEAQEQFAYWRQKLRGASDVNLPTDYPRPTPGAVSLLAGRTAVLPASLSQSIRDFNRQEGCTFFMTTMAAFLILLGRSAGQEDFIVGTYTAGRHRPETEKVIGMFSNSLALRASLSGDPTVRELLEQVRDTTLEAYARQVVPFRTLAQVLQPNFEELGLPPLNRMRVLCVHENSSMAGGEADPVSHDSQSALSTGMKLPGGLILRPLEFEHVEEAAHDLILHLQERATELSLLLEYDTALFRASTIERMLTQLQTLLTVVTSAPHHRLSALEFSW